MKNKITTKAWFSNHHQFTIAEFMPLLRVLSYASNHLSKIEMFFSKLFIEENLFPIKAEIPLKLSLKAIIILENFKNNWKKNLSFFKADEKIYDKFIKKTIYNTKYGLISNDLMTPSNETLKRMYEKLKVNREDSSYYNEEEDSEQIEIRYQDMIKANESWSHKSSFSSNLFISRDWKEKAEINMINYSSSNKIKTMHDVYKRSSKIIKIKGNYYL